MRYENTSDAERRHHHPGGHGHGPGFSGFGRGGGYRRGRGRGFGRPGGWQQADLPLTDDLTAWLAGRLPDDWFTGAPQVTVDREEITVIGELPAPAGVLSNTKTPIATVHPATNAASRARRGETFGRLTNSRCTPSRIAGTRTTVVTALEIPRLRHSIQ